jgi:hypothetical protein
MPLAAVQQTAFGDVDELKAFHRQSLIRRVKNGG